MANDLGLSVKTKLYQLLSAITYDGKPIPVHNTLAGVNAGTMWVTVEDYSQRPDGTKLRPMYQSTVLIEVVVKGDDYAMLNGISNQVIAMIYTSHGNGIDMDSCTAYVVGEPTITEMAQDDGSEIYLRKQLMVNLKLSPK